MKLTLRWWGIDFIWERLEFFKKAIVMLSLPMQLIKSEAFGTVSVCQCDSGSDKKATALLATVRFNTRPHRNLEAETLELYLQKHS